MKIENASDLFSLFYVDRYAKEFPMIFKMVNFKSKRVLDVESGKEGYLIKEILKHTDKVTATNSSKDAIKNIRKHVGVKTSICRAEKLPFTDKSFDIIISRWAIMHTKNIKKAIDEACRVSRDRVLIILPSENGDETKLLQIKSRDKHKSRKKRILDIKEYFKSNDFSVTEKRNLLGFVFPDEIVASDIMSAIGFSNKISKKQYKQMLKFFESRKTRDGVRMTQGASYILAKRRF